MPFLEIMGALAGSERGVTLVLRQVEAMAAVPGEAGGTEGGLAGGACT